MKVFFLSDASYVVPEQVFIFRCSKWKLDAEAQTVFPSASPALQIIVEICRERWSAGSDVTALCWNFQWSVTRFMVLSKILKIQRNDGSALSLKISMKFPGKTTGKLETTF